MNSSAIAAFAAFSLLSGCQSAGLSGGVVEDIPQNSAERGGGNVEGTVFGEGGLIDTSNLLGGGADQNKLPVNKYLWRASLDTLAFLPIASVDTFSGVIATDWGASPDSPNERVRATAYVKDEALSATALDVTVFREVLQPGGAWASAPVSPETAERLEDAILTRARQLRIEDVDA